MFFCLKANLAWNFRLGLFLKVACVSVMGVPVLRAFTVLNSKESQLFSINMLLEDFWSIIEQLGANHDFYIISLSSTIIFNYFIN